MKQIIEISESGLYAVVGEKIYRLVELSISPVIDESESTPTFALKRKKYKTRAGKPGKPAKNKGARSITCRICEQKGHFAKTCPNRDGMLPPDEVPEKREITKEMVDALRAEHPLWDTLKIAAELKCRLHEVNKHW